MTGQQVMARLRERDGDGELLGLVKRIAAAHHVTQEELLSHDRGAAACRARHAFWSRLSETGHWSFSRIGKVFGYDHVSVMNGIDAHRALIGLPPRVKKQGKTCESPTEQELPTKDVA